MIAAVTAPIRLDPETSLDQDAREISRQGYDPSRVSNDSADRGIQGFDMTSTSTQQGPSKLKLALIAVLAMSALAISGYLAWHGLRVTSVAGCGGGVFDCDHVLTSKWSKFMGIPVAGYAVLTYSIMLCALAVRAISSRPSIRGHLLSLVRLLCFTAGFAAVWFIAVQAFVIQHFCLYCLAAHGCGLSLMAIVAFAKWGFVSRRMLGGLGFSAVATLASIQTGSTPAPTYEVHEYEVTAETDPAEEIVVPDEISPFDFDDMELPADESDMLISVEPQEDPTLPTEALEPGNAVVPTKTTTGRGWSTGDLLVSRLDRPGYRDLTGQAARALSKSVLRHTRIVPMLVAVATLSDSAVLPAQEPKAKPRKISFGSVATLQVNQWPLIGDQDAPRIAAEVFDYTCPACRATAPALEKAYQNYDGAMAIIALPVPMNRQCNKFVSTTPRGHEQACELAKIAIAVWLAKPAAFAEFHHWMMQGAAAPNAATAEVHAKSLVGDSAYEKMIRSKKPTQYLSANIKIYENAGKGKIPKLLLKKTSLVGQTTSPNVIKDLLDRDK